LVGTPRPCTPTVSAPRVVLGSRPDEEPWRPSVNSHTRAATNTSPPESAARDLIEGSGLQGLG
jgi:hypothetical protein